MISVAGTLSDKDTSAGYSYFIKKYGFSPAFLSERISFGHNDPPVAPEDMVHGWIYWKSCKLPVLVPPFDLNGKGSGIFEYTDIRSTFPCAVTSGQDIIISLDIFRHLGLFLSGHLEKVWASPGNMREEFIKIPFADYYSDILFSCLVQAQAGKNQPLIYKTFWPEGKPFAVSLTHDVDEIRKTYQWLTYPARKITRGDWRGLTTQCRSFIRKLRGDEPFWTFDALSRLEDSLGVRSSLYFLHETGKVSITDKETWRHAGRRYRFADPRVRAVLRDLFRREWDVGLHGSFYSYTNEETISSEKRELEQALGQTVCGGRQHNLNLKIPYTWLIQERAGLIYDSTLGYNDCMGFRWGISFPFRPFLPDENRLSGVLQLPLVIEDLPYFRSPTRWEDFLDICRRVHISHGMITLLWHHSVFNEMEFPGWAKDYADIIGYCKKMNAWVTDAKSISRWWTGRENTGFSYEYYDNTIRLKSLSNTSGCYLDLVLPEGRTITLLEKAIIMNKLNNIITIRTSPLNRSECATVTLSG